jgi:hypothetical protein
MNKLLTSALLLCGAASAFAQTPFTTRDSVNINKINAMVLVHGDMWWNPAPGVMQPHCFFPNGTTKSISSAGGIWMSAIDNSGLLHTSAQTFRVNGSDYWPGPLTSDTLTYAESQKWAKIWKVNRTDIQHFLHLTTLNATTVPTAIWTWPAKGNANAQGAGGAALTINTDMAPFIDVNANGLYEPAMGDYPDVKGDQALWWVFSDKGPTHTESNGRSLGVEVHAMAYAYNRGTLVDNIVYYEYKVQNKSTNNYNNFRIGQMADVDLGDFSDDYIGFDSNRAVGYVYNGNTTDAQYGPNLPIAGLMIVDAHIGTTATRAGSFMYYNNDHSLIGVPMVDTEFSNYMRSKTREGQHATNDMTGPGSMSRGYGPGPQVKYLYTGDPSVNTNWSECGANNIPGDRRMIIASGDMTVPANGIVTLVMAQVVTNPDTTHACGDTLSISDLLAVADTAKAIYDGGSLPPLPDAVTNVYTNNTVSVFPNPAHSILYIDNATHDITGAEQLSVFNTVGQQLALPINKNGSKYQADISQLAPGLYYVRYKAGQSSSTVKFLKE